MQKGTDSTPCIRPMTVRDIPLAMRLKAQAGWNQTPQDFERFLFLEPAGCLVGELAGVPLATATAFVFDHVGWIAMILVAAEARGRGLGTAITRHALRYLESRDVRSIRLDATPLGRPIYRKLGFVPQYDLGRFVGVASSHKTDPRVGPLLPGDLERVLQLDQYVTATRRDRLLRRLHEESPDTFYVMREAEMITGYLTSRAGSNGRQIGPGIAISTSAGLALLDGVAAQHAGAPIVIDIPCQNHVATAWATDRGLIAQRSLTSMSRGPAIAERAEAIWASSGPEKG
ncbi:MAG: GNAT family N-acetyltransferase [Pirellulales bacterium]